MKEGPFIDRKACKEYMLMNFPDEDD